MSKSEQLPPFTFFQLLWRFTAAVVFTLLMVCLQFYLVFPNIRDWFDYFQELPNYVSFSSGDLFLTIWFPALLAFPFAAFPPHWSSQEGAKKRVMFLLWLTVGAIVLNIYARIMFQTHLQNYFLPRGYVQCETERFGHDPMIKDYDFATDPSLCVDGVK